ncbi:MAG: bifunctional adenosylcobinamide kinase/adenosylcobinamide-phosphate guanylyltransferase, partial [Chloroflexota bacterium]|nr:bifunctional adenosylcobinamide kinase/adenosylcobinamide-phosphate guanylyltransferase [Chloroflexota bacterium]
AEHLDAAVAAELEALEAARRAGGWDLAVVTNEVGLGIVPATPVGRLFRDALGRANQRLAAAADAVYLLVAGLPLRIKPTCPTCAPEGWS